MARGFRELLNILGKNRKMLRVKKEINPRFDSDTCSTGEFRYTIVFETRVTTW